MADEQHHDEYHHDDGAMIEHPTEGASPQRSAYSAALDDLKNIRSAGNPRAGDLSLQSLEHLRETEMALFTEVPEEYIIAARKSTAHQVPSRVGSTYKEGYEGTPKKRQDPLHHVGQSLCDPNKPIPTTWKKGSKPAAHYEVQSTYSTLFSASASADAASPDKIHEKGTRRQEIEEKRKERMSKMVPPAKPGSTKSGLQPLPPKPTKKVPSVFVPACAANSSITDENNRRREIERVKEEESRSRPTDLPFR